MLNSRAYSMAGDMILTQPLPAGDYDVYLWLFEPAAANSRAFDIEVNGQMAERGAGKVSESGGG